MCEPRLRAPLHAGFVACTAAPAPDAFHGLPTRPSLFRRLADRSSNVIIQVKWEEGAGSKHLAGMDAYCPLYVCTLGACFQWLRSQQRSQQIEAKIATNCCSSCMLSLLCAQTHPCLTGTPGKPVGLQLLLPLLVAYPGDWLGGSVPPPLHTLCRSLPGPALPVDVPQAACSPPSPPSCADRRCPSAAAPLGPGARAPSG